MIKRTFSTLALWATVSATLFFFGAHGGLILITLIALATQYEFYRLLKQAGYPALVLPGCLWGGLLLLLPYFFSGEEALALIGAQGQYLLILGIIVIALFALREEESQRLPVFLTTTAGLVYIPYLLGFFIALVLLPENPGHGLLLAVWVIVVVKFTDVGAYLTGSLIGRHKLAPSLSPGKTWEGAIGGIVISASLGALFVLLFRDAFPESITPARGALLALPLAVLSIPSDLLESVVKRAAKAKDSGRTIPGIGGAYDLSDSLILTAPLAYWLLSLFY